jgi:PAS domain S-box-containing protein
MSSSASGPAHPDAILDALPVGVALLHGDDFTYEYVNRAYQDMAPERRFLECTVADAWPELAGEVVPLLRQVVETGQPFHAEDMQFEVERGAPGIRMPLYFTFTYQPLLAEPEHVIRGVVVTVTDTTRRKEAEQRLLRQASELRESEARFRAMADSAPVLIWVSGLDKRCTWFNRSWLEFTGRTMEQELGHGWTEGVHPDDLRHCLDTCSEHFDRGTPFTTEYRHRRHDGSYRWLLDSSAPRLDATGAFGGYIGTCLDITERKQAEDALRESEVRFRVLASEAPVGIFQADPRGHVLYLNRAGQVITGLSEDEARGGGWEEAIHPDDRARVTREWYDAVSGERIFASEYRFRSPQHKVSWVRGLGAPLLDDAGQSMGYIGILVDLTEQRTLQSQLAVASRLAAVETLVMGLAHEINNPLTSVVVGERLALEGLAKMRQALRSGAQLDRDATARLLDDLVDALRDADLGGQRIASIVKDLSLFGSQDLRRTRVRLTDVVDLAMRRVPASVFQGATVQFQDREPPDVMGSVGQLAQVLVALVMNSFSAIPAGRRGVIIVTLGPGSPGMARLEVTDNGTGIEPQVMDRIFEPFFTTREVGKGMGLGLAVCHAIVTAHGGTITASSTPGEGATFRVELPAAEETG